MQTPTLRAQRTSSFVRPGFAVGATLALTLLAAACNRKTFEPTPFLPAVNATSPAEGAGGVHLDAVVTATFNEALDGASVTAATFTLSNGATAVPAAVSYAGVTATLVPASPLAENTKYTATITTGVRDPDGDHIAHSKTWIFTTGISPTVLSTIPAGGASAVSRIASVKATFSTSMDPATITAATFTLQNGLVAVPAVVTYAATIATLTPSSILAANTVYTATISTGAQDVGGMRLNSARTWTFTTGGVPTVPTVLSTNPANAATGASRSGSITATFSEAMDPATITGTTFTLKNGLVGVPAVVTYAGTTATLNPSSTLAANTTYTANITTGAKNVAGVSLSPAHSWTFTTVATSVNGPAIVNLGTAGNFVILAKSGVSTTGATAVVGDVGLSPAAATFLTGFAIIAPPTTSASSAQVTGLLYAADYDPPTPTMLNTAVLDMQAAFTDAAGRTLPDFTELAAGNIQGLNLTPGLYKWGTGVQIPSAVTLTGGANAVWIFQIAQDLTVGNGAIVTLAGGAQAKNVFWQVAGQATLGTTANFKGIILSQTLISMNTGTIMLGRALAQTAVTLNATQITNP